jgi:hypothetical protein
MTAPTLQEYFAKEFAEGKIDHVVRAHVHAGVVEIYIHPHGRDGVTTSTLIVEGNRVRPRCFGFIDIERHANLRRQGVNVAVFVRGVNVTSRCVGADDTPGSQWATLHKLDNKGRRYIDPDTSHIAIETIEGSDVEICAV